MKDIINEIRILQSELMRLKSRDKARPMIADRPISGSYIIPKMEDGQSIIVTVESELRDWPQLDIDVYDTRNNERTTPPIKYRVTEDGLSATNRFALRVGRAPAGIYRIDWVILSQTGKTVTFEVK